MREWSVNEEFMMSILDAISCFVVVDADGKVVYLNKKYAGILNVKPDKAKGRPVEEIIPNTRMSIVTKTGKEEVGSVFEMKNGKTVVCNRYPIVKNGEIIGAMAYTTFIEFDEIKTFIEQINCLNNKVSLYRSQLQQLRGAKYSLEQIIGKDPSILKIKSMIKKVGQTKSTVLITGETGTGKELVAHSIHQESNRRHKPFIRLNCAAIPKDLLESELFGYEEGAFTGAKKGGKPGKFELAEGGSLLLDEINQMPINLQSKLLRVIQEKELERVGGLKTREINVRLICISNVDLEELVIKGEFRADLYYRINVVRIDIPSLRERMDDIEEITNYSIEKINRELGLNITGVSKDVLKLFKSYDWPGNVRELEHVIERAANMVFSGVLTKEYFDFLYLRCNERKSEKSIRFGEINTLEEYKSHAEKEAITRALAKSNGNKKEAAQLLKIDRSVLYDKLKKYKIFEK